MNLAPGALVAISISALACAGLVACEYKNHRLGRVLLKSLASSAFVAAPLLGGAYDRGPFTNWIIIGLVLGALGDIALLGESKRSFLIGLSVFLAGHVAYVVAFTTLVPLATWPQQLGLLMLAPLLFGAVVLRWLWPHLGKMRIPVIFYVVVITSMVVGAAAVATAGQVPTVTKATLTVGALLFFASDLAVARQRFVARSFANKAWGLPAYYAGQLLIVVAILSSRFCFS